MKTVIGKPTLIFLLLLCMLPAGRGRAEDAGVCARVKIELDQKVAITRTAFRATLTLGNSPANVPLQNVKVTLDIRGAANAPANAKFGISSPVLTHLTVDGAGTLPPGVQGSAVWTILPTRDAAPDADTPYTVGGTIAYTQGGVSVSLPLFPAPITVKPDPLLQFHYFLQKQVYGDDPFTPEVEPAEPFSLAVLAVNKGKGTAHNLSITSSQPKIIDNQKGLQIQFQIVGSFVNNRPATPSLQVGLGDIAPGGTSVGDWLLVSTLQGKFLDFTASFKHNDDLNNPRTSILDSVDTHFLEHVVRVTAPADDGKPDFLTIEAANPNTLPDTVWDSADGSTAPVTALSSASDDSGPLPLFITDGPVTNANLTVHLIAPVTTSGFVYLRTDDPGGSVYQLTGVTRSDGKAIALGDNAWTTHRTIRLKNQAPYAQSRLYLFDSGSTGLYTLTYAPVTPLKPTVQITSPGNGSTFSPGATLTVAASAASLQAAVQKVDFFADGIPLGTAAATPFQIAYAPGVGPHSLKAVATDANGTASDPAFAAITVNASANQPPTVSLSGPGGAASLYAPAAVTLAASASDPDGSVAKVDFYNNGQFLGSSVSAPYTLTLPALPAGDYAFTATATDSQGASATSRPAVLTINPALSGTGAALLRVVSAVRLSVPGQMAVTIQNAGGSNAAAVTLAVSRIKWGAQSLPTVSPASVPMLTPNSTATFVLQFPASDSSRQLKLYATYSGRSVSSFVPVTP